MRTSVWIALLIAGLGCQKSTGSQTPSPPPAGFDERQACTTDADCAVVEIECCDHCNGGTVVGVHKDSAGDIRTEYAGKAECKDTACTRRGCTSPPVAICRQQRCGVSIGGDEQMTPLPRP